MYINQSWADIRVLVGGASMIELIEVDYTVERKAENHYGVGPLPVSRGTGNVEFTNLTMKISFDELKRLEAAAPNGDITLYAPFTINFAWLPTVQKPLGAADNLYNVQFTKRGASFKQGETKHYVTLEGVFAGINTPV